MFDGGGGAYHFKSTIDIQKYRHQGKKKIVGTSPDKCDVNK